MTMMMRILQRQQKNKKRCANKNQHNLSHFYGNSQPISVYTTFMLFYKLCTNSAEKIDFTQKKIPLRQSKNKTERKISYRN